MFSYMHFSANFYTTNCKVCEFTIPYDNSYNDKISFQNHTKPSTLNLTNITNMLSKKE